MPPELTPLEEFAEDGRLLARSERLEGLPHGRVERFGPTGLPQLAAHYNQGVLDGPLKVFDEDGTLIQEACYKAGKAHGLSRLFSNGRCIAEQQYVQGRLEGESIFYDEGGNITARQNFRLGRLEGLSQFFAQGQLLRKAHYRAGLLDGESTDHDPQGRLVQLAHYKANVLHGLTRRFGADGKPREELVYRDGQLLTQPPLPSPAIPPAEHGLLARLEQLLKG